MEPVDIWTLVIAGLGVLVSGGFACWAVLVARDAKALAEKEFARNTEQPVIDWSYRWDIETLSVIATNVGLDTAQDVTLTVHRYGRGAAEGFTEHCKREAVERGDSVSLPIPQITEYREADRLLSEVTGPGKSLLDIVSRVSQEYGGPSRSELMETKASAIGMRFSQVHCVLRWKTPAENPKPPRAFPLDVTWRDHS